VRSMAMGKRKSQQAPMWVATTDLPVSPGHPFYGRLNAIRDEGGFDRFAEEQCRAFYAPVIGRPSLPPGRYFRCCCLATSRGWTRNGALLGVRRIRLRCAPSWGSASTRRLQIIPRSRARDA
jgi:hypothetical protein